MVYLLLGNYIYFAKVLPTLGEHGRPAAPRFTPTAQLKQVEEYLSLLSRTADRPWFLGYLRHIRLVTLLLLGLMLSFLIIILWSFR